MHANRFDTVSRLFAGRRLSRRQALTQGGAGLAAGALAAGGLTAAAQDATPPAAPASDHGPRTLFVQSFEQGGIAPKAGAEGTYTLTLAHGLGQTIYFSDRPERVVGATPTPDFLKALGFPPDNPPNAALVLAAGPGDEDIAVLELFNPRYDEATHTATYDVTLLEEWDRTLAMGFAERPTDLAQLHPSFGAAHLFIDDCPDSDMNCVQMANGDVPGTIPNADHDGYCYSWNQGACLPCRPWYDGYSDASNYWSGQCNQRFAACENGCSAFPICVSGLNPNCE
jgi:hypothetical protein